MRALRTQSEGPPRPNEPLREQRSAIPEHVGVLRDAVVQFADASGASRRMREQIALAVSEALSNCVLHAYADRDQPGLVTVEAAVREGALIVLVSDEGRGMVPRLDSPGLGIGLPLIAQMCDQFDIEARDDRPGVRLSMTFAISQSR
jgi:anti-sigma regulatory factor (Ser/Thr protein kinase)